MTNYIKRTDVGTILKLFYGYVSKTSRQECGTNCMHRYMYITFTYELMLRILLYVFDKNLHSFCLLIVLSVFLI